MQDLPPIVIDDEKAAQNSKREPSESRCASSHSFCRSTVPLGSKWMLGRIAVIPLQANSLGCRGALSRASDAHARLGTRIPLSPETCLISSLESTGQSEQVFGISDASKTRVGLIS
jgi:hypothetical protein